MNNFGGDFKFVDCPTHEKHKIKCPINKKRFHSIILKLFSRPAAPSDQPDPATLPVSGTSDSLGTMSVTSDSQFKESFSHKPEGRLAPFQVYGAGL